jgi:hypothetical protein
MYSKFEGRAAVTVGVNSSSEYIHPFVYENNSQNPNGQLPMSDDKTTHPATLSVSQISAFKPGNGQGSDIMNYLCNAADEFEVRLCIQAEAQSSGRRTLAGTGLISWYRKFGFHGNGAMFREPKTWQIPLRTFI